MSGCTGKTHQQFNDIVSESESNEDILGLILTGSRGKGFEHEKSDYDVWMVTKDEASSKELDQKYNAIGLEGIDLCIVSLKDYEKLDEWGGGEEYDRYDFTHCKVLVSKTADVQRITDEKGDIPEIARDSFIRGTLDAYINQVFRSAKCYRDGEQFGAHLEAAMGVPCLLDLVYGIEGRPKPFFRYLKQEIEYFPLKNFQWENDDFIYMVSSILSTGDLKTQQELLKIVEKMFRNAGYDKVFDDWEGKDKWAMEFKLS